ncbi:hypothetical protein ACFL35_19100 [Candidatus Riflebacteria bacterium]
MANKMKRALTFLPFIFVCLLLAGCFGRGRLSPNILLKIAEKNLQKKKYKKAIKLFESVYKHVAATEEEKLWSYYRLGVCSEVSGDRDEAIFHYSGDEGNNNFYKPSKRINNFVRFGLHSLIVKHKQRTYEEILELEESEIGFKEKKLKKRKKRKVRRRKPKVRKKKKRKRKKGRVVTIYLPKASEIKVEKSFGLAF